MKHVLAALLLLSACDGAENTSDDKKTVEQVESMPAVEALTEVADKTAEPVAEEKVAAEAAEPAEEEEVAAEPAEEEEAEPALEKEAEPDSEKVNLQNAVSKTGEFQYEISASLFAEVTKPDMILKQARFVPTSCEGKACGFKLYAFKEDSLLSLLGFEQGDRAHKLNEKTLSSIDKLEEVFSLHKDDSEFSIDVVRRHKEFTIKIRVVES